MELEELNPSALIGPQQDIEPIEHWAERNGMSFGIARAWVRIPRSSGHPFHKHLTTDSTVIRPPIPRVSDH